MGTLTLPHWEAVTPELRDLLAVLGGLPELQPFYLAGGTALGLHLGHRVSQDLDLFANIESLEDNLRRSIVEKLAAKRTVERLQDSVLGLVLQVDDQPVSFFTYGYPLLASPEPVSGIHVAALIDIGLMKLDAIAGRGTRKDFYDLYFIASRIPLDELFARSPEKYPETRGFGMRVLAALVDFDIADQQQDPKMLHPVEWEQVKVFFLAEARRLGQEWFGGNRDQGFER
jgi:Nucleotidyl transferase AbiEii toxin, Type IV TA system